MTDMQRIYDEMWHKSLPRFQTGDYEIDAQIQSDADTRTGLTASAEFQAKSAETLSVSCNDSA